MTRTDSFPDGDRISAYLFDHLSPKERSAFESAMTRDQTLRTLVEVRRRGLEALKQPFDLESGEAGRQRLLRRVAGQQPLRTGSRALYVTTFGAVVAAIVVLIGTIAFGRSRTAETPPEFVKTYATTVGQRASLLLEDGTRVMLAPRSTLGVTRGFGQRTRAVTLTGEAIFDVPTASGIPFLVHTGTITTRVLGTRFDVRRYDTDARTRVAVISGKVIVTSRTHAALTLAAGAIGAATDSAVAMVSQDSAAEAIAWSGGMLVFRNAPMSTVLAELGHWYGYRFRLTDSALATNNVTARFRIGSSSAALAHLKLLLNADLAFDGNLVTIRQRPFPRTLSRDRREVSDTFTFTQSEAGR